MAQTPGPWSREEALTAVRLLCRNEFAIRWRRQLTECMVTASRVRLVRKWRGETGNGRAGFYEYRTGRLRTSGSDVNETRVEGLIT